MRSACAVVVVAISLMTAAFIHEEAGHAAGVVSDCDEDSLDAAMADGGTVTFACSGTITFTATKSLVGNSSVVIDGAGHEVTFSGDGKAGLFNVGPAASLELRGVTLADGSAVHGGAIYNAGTLVVRDSTFEGNMSGDRGGAIANFGQHAQATVIGSTFVGNAAFGGGAIANGIFVGMPGRLTVINSTFYQNHSSFHAGAIFTGDQATIINSTFAENSADESGNAIFDSSDGELRVVNSIVADDFPGSECFTEDPGKVVDGGGNIVPDESCGFPKATDPDLGPLSDNGGPTQTMAITFASSAFGVGIPQYCTAAPPEGAGGVDQRGALRRTCSAGAFEPGGLLERRGVVPLVGRDADPPPATAVSFAIRGVQALGQGLWRIQADYQLNGTNDGDWGAFVYYVNRCRDASGKKLGTADGQGGLLSANGGLLGAISGTMTFEFRANIVSDEPAIQWPVTCAAVTLFAHHPLSGPPDHTSTALLPAITVWQEGSGTVVHCGEPCLGGW